MPSLLALAPRGQQHLTPFDTARVQAYSQWRCSARVTDFHELTKKSQKKGNYVGRISVKKVASRMFMHTICSSSKWVGNRRPPMGVAISLLSALADGGRLHCHASADVLA